MCRQSVRSLGAGWRTYIVLTKHPGDRSRAHAAAPALNDYVWRCAIWRSARPGVQHGLHVLQESWHLRLDNAHAQLHGSLAALLLVCNTHACALRVVE
eukprot:6197385-Pleurochrysis_carterae.AAC.2